MQKQPFPVGWGGGGRKFEDGGRGGGGGGKGWGGGGGGGGGGGLKILGIREVTDMGRRSVPHFIP